jgi:hypothetical protein
MGTNLRRITIAITPGLDKIKEDLSSVIGSKVNYPKTIRHLVVNYFAQTKPKKFEFSSEAHAFKSWYDAWWIGDGDDKEAIPERGDPSFDRYVIGYTLGFGAWMAAKHHTQEKKK